MLGYSAAIVQVATVKSVILFGWERKMVCSLSKWDPACDTPTFPRSRNFPPLVRLSSWKSTASVGKKQTENVRNM